MDNIITPTIHLNGTGAETLSSEYETAYLEFLKFRHALCSVTFHGRDYYVRDGDWAIAAEQRQEIHRMIGEVEQYIDAIRQSIHDQIQ